MIYEDSISGSLFKTLFRNTQKIMKNTGFAEIIFPKNSSVCGILQKELLSSIINKKLRVKCLMNIKVFDHCSNLMKHPISRQK